MKIGAILNFRGTLCKPSKENGKTILRKFKRHKCNGQSNFLENRKTMFQR